MTCTVFSCRRYCRASLTALLLIAAHALISRAQIIFSDFASPQGLSFVGDAKVAGKALRLTPARSNRAGAVWFRDKPPVRSGFEAVFQFQITQPSWLFHGTDGFAFVVQNAGLEALGGRGSAAGFGMPDPTNPRRAGIPWMIAVFFDTCRNTEEGDPSANYIALRANAGPGGMRWPARRLAFTPNLSIRLKDRKVHMARIVFQPPLLSIFLDGSVEPVLETKADFSLATDKEGRAWIGFTAATGWGYENHDILSWSFGRASVSSSLSMVTSDISFAMSACLPDRNLCTPERPFVQSKGDGYHVVLPGNAEWGVSVPTLSRETAVVSNAHGIVCWEPKALGADGCSLRAGARTPVLNSSSRMRPPEPWSPKPKMEACGFQ